MATAPAVTSQVTRKTKTPRTPTRSIVSSLDEIKEEDDAKSDATVSDDESFKSQYPTRASLLFSSAPIIIDRYYCHYTNLY